MLAGPPQSSSGSTRRCIVGYSPTKQAMEPKDTGEESVTSCMPESLLTWQSLIDKVAPPRDPNEDEEEEEDEDDGEEEDDEPAVIREPDEG
jgi:hypothetical protein